MKSITKNLIKSILNEVDISPENSSTSEKEVDLLKSYNEFINKIKMYETNLIKNYENSLKNVFVNRTISLRARQSNIYAPSRDHQIQVKSISLSEKSSDSQFWIIFTDKDNSVYYCDKEFKPKIIESFKDL